MAVVIGALSYVTYSMNVLSDFSQSLITEEKRQKDKQSVEYDVSSINIAPSNKLDGIVTNTGQIPLEIKSLWIEEIGVPDSVKRFDPHITIAPGDSVDLINYVDFTMDPTKGYDMRIISGRGIIQTFHVNSPSSQNLFLQLHAIPNSVPSTFETTLLFTIVNNSTRGSFLYNLTPEISAEPVGSATTSHVSGPIPPTYPVLGPGEVATFQYVYSITGDTGDGATYTAYLENSLYGNNSTATVLVKEVTLATQAGTSLESFGLANELASKNDILYFHDESNLTPLGEYQMDGADPNGPGTTISPSDAFLQFISAEMTTTNTIQGNIPWNATFNYYSHIVPPDVTYPSLAFFFDCDNCGESDDTIESAGNHNNIQTMDKEGGSDIPIFVATGGPFNDGYYNFAGDRMKDNWNVDGGSESNYGEPQYAPDSTAVWVRIPPTTDNYQTIIRFGEDDQGDEDLYAIQVGDGTSGNQGKIVFIYDTDKINNNDHITDCVSDSRHDDNQWVFVVGVRNSNAECILYINGIEQIDKDVTCCYSSQIVEVDWIGVGWDGDDASGEMNGDVALWMHWNDHALTQQEVTSLYNTNYGESATRIDIAVEETNSAGVVTETYITDNAVEFPFIAPGRYADSSGDEEWDFFTTNSTDEKYGVLTYKMPYIVENKTLVPTERFRLTLNENSSPGLPLFLRVDDNTMTIPSHIQTAPVEPKWPTYLSFDRDDQVTYVTYNEGPNGVWFNYQGTRLVLTTLDGINSFGAIVSNVNGSEINADRDSIYFPAGTFAAIEFWQLGQPPEGPPNGPPGANRPDVGDYNAAVFLSGYDESGEVFLRSIKLGLVHITN